MNRTLAQLIGWSSLVIGCALIAIVVLVPPWLELHYAQWEKGWIEACARTQQDQVEAYEQFASALASNDPILLQRLAHHHLRLKPTNTDLVDLTEGEQPILFHDTSGSASTSTSADASKAPLIEQWLHKSYPVIGQDYANYEAPDHMVIRLSTGPKRLILLALGGLFLLCGIILPGPAQPRAITTQDDDTDDDDDGEFVAAEIDDDDEDADKVIRAMPWHRAA